MKGIKHRTQISLEQWQYQRLLELSRKKKKSLSAVVRELISEKFATETPVRGKDPLFGVIGLGAGDGSAVASDHDRYLYGKKK